MAEIPTLFLKPLADEINAEHAATEASIRAGLAHAHKAGKLLLEAKSKTPPDAWLRWLAGNVRMSFRTAQGYMRIARKWDELGAKCATGVAHLGYRESLELLADHVEQDIPMPPFEVGKSYLFARTGVPAKWPAPVLLEVAPASAHGFWLLLTLFAEGAADRAEQWYEFTQRGIRLNEPEIWKMSVEDTPFAGEWQEIDRPLYLNHHPDLNPPGTITDMSPWWQQRDPKLRVQGRNEEREWQDLLCKAITAGQPLTYEERRPRRRS